MIETNINESIFRQTSAIDILAFAKACLHDCFHRRGTRSVLASNDL